MSDNRPCQGDAFVKAVPKRPYEDCGNCQNIRLRGGKCLGWRGWLVARDAGVKLEGDG